MANIYDITQDYLTILEMAQDPEIDPQLIADTFEAIDGELEMKAESYAKVMKNLEGDIKALKAEEDRLALKRKTIENNIKRMKTTLKDVMEITGKTKFKTELFSFNIQNNPPSVVMDTTDIKSIPKKYLKTKDPEIDKAAIKEALLDNKNLKSLKGVAHLEQTQGLRIR